MRLNRLRQPLSRLSMIAELFSATVIIGILSSGVRLATPYLFAALGETFSQRSGVLNLGVEGQMLMGAFAGFYVTFQTQNPWLGLLAAAVIGALMGLAMAVVSVTFKAERSEEHTSELQSRENLVCRLL